MGNTRLALTVEVNPGNRHAASHVTPSLWRYYDGLADNQKPALIRGDLFLGNEGFLTAAEQRGAQYLTKLRLTTGVKRCMTRLLHDQGSQTLPSDQPPRCPGLQLVEPVCPPCPAPEACEAITSRPLLLHGVAS